MLKKKEWISLTKSADQSVMVYILTTQKVNTYQIWEMARGVKVEGREFAVVYTMFIMEDT